MNKNWFFDNLNYAQRQKVWATKVPRFGEIIWFFPFGDSQECNRAVVFNTIEKTWYDFELSRTAGFYSQVFRYPVWAGDSSRRKVHLTLTGVTGSFVAGDSVSGSTTNVPCIVDQVIGTNEVVVYASNPSRVTLLVPGETLVNNSRSGAGSVITAAEAHSVYIHEKGLNSVTSLGEQAIEAYFESSDFGFPTGGAQQNNIEGLNRWTRLIRVEPDFLMSGPMEMRVISREFAQQPDTVSELFTFEQNTGKIDLRKQGRQIRLRFTSNTLNGNFEMGRVILHTEPGDVRS
jgi:hypothetical protein